MLKRKNISGNIFPQTNTNFYPVKEASLLFKKLLNHKLMPAAGEKPGIFCALNFSGPDVEPFAQY